MSDARTCPVCATALRPRQHYCQRRCAKRAYVRRRDGRAISDQDNRDLRVARAARAAARRRARKHKTVGPPPEPMPEITDAVLEFFGCRRPAPLQVRA